MHPGPDFFVYRVLKAEMCANQLETCANSSLISFPEHFCGIFSFDWASIMRVNKQFRKRRAPCGKNNIRCEEF